MKKKLLFIVLISFFIGLLGACSNKKDLLCGKWSLVQSQKLKGSQVISIFYSPVLMVLNKDGSGFSQKKIGKQIVRRKIKWTYKKPFLQITTFSPANKTLLRLWEVLKIDEKKLIVGYGSQKIRIEHIFKKVNS